MAEVLRFPNASHEPQDDAAARATALDTTLSAIVEAPAGSGKTGLLMQRYLKLLADPAVTQPEEVLAITFTNKAAAELRERVLKELEAAHHNVPIEDAFDQLNRDFATAVLARDAQLQWNLLTRPHRLNLRTIDSVCAEIANSLPLLSGSGAPRRPTEDAVPLYRQAAQRTLFQLGGSDATLHAALRTILLHRDASLADVERLLAQMLAAREQWGELIPLDPNELTSEALDNEVRPRLERTLEVIVCAGLSKALNALPAHLLTELTTLAADLGIEPGYKDAPSPISLCANLRLPPQALSAHLDHWLALIHLVTTASSKTWRKGFNANHVGFNLPKAAKADLQRIIADLESHGANELLDALLSIRTLPPSRYPEEQWAVAKALFHVLRRALAELRVLFAESGECDFTELALAAREALRADATAPDIALAFGSKLRHLLVDEMQDTSSGQYELIHLLTQSWDGHNQTLFLVGDPKQSIYLFRQARVERFLRTMHDQRLGDITLTPLRLTANFRSQATLVASFNSTFAQLFPTPEAAARQSTLTDVPFVAANPQRKPSPLTDGLNWQPAILDPNNPATIPHELQQARNIRAIIEHWLNTPLPPTRTEPWRIAILARARTHLTAIVAELKQSNIPYRAVDIDPLDELPEVLDALALTRALLHPADRVAWLAILHAPWCGLSLADLLTLTGEGPTASPEATLAYLVDTRAHLLSPTGQQLLARTWPILRKSLSTLGRTSLHIHVERTWRSLGGDAPLTADQRLNVLRFLETLAALETEGSRIDLNALHARLRKLYAEPAPGNPSVELLTMHKAKGLEWDIVLVPSLERKGGRSSSDLLTWLELDGTADHPASVLLAPIAGRGQESSRLNDWIRSIREARENSERKRLFYVACTRAREELHLFGAVKLDTNGNLASPIHGSLLKSCWPAAEPAFLEAAQHRATTAQPINLNVALSQSITFDELANEPPILIEEDTMSLVASAETTPAIEPPPPILHRLPLTFDPLARFTTTPRLNYLPAAALPHAPAFDRPEGSFAVRAFGNVVHRYLQLLADRLASTTPEQLLTELPTWHPRLLASLRGEGLAPTQAGREATRALRALALALNDPTGRWILSPHPEAASEQSLTLTSPETAATLNLRADRTFLAADSPLSLGQSHIWIVDFKTAELNNRSLDLFRATELAKYQPQLEAYAQVRRSLPNGDLPIRLGLFYPLVPLLLDWTSSPGPSV